MLWALYALSEPLWGPWSACGGRHAWGPQREFLRCADDSREGEGRRPDPVEQATASLVATQYRPSATHL